MKEYTSLISSLQIRFDNAILIDIDSKDNEFEVLFEVQRFCKIWGFTAVIRETRKGFHIHMKSKLGSNLLKPTREAILILLLKLEADHQMILRFLKHNHNALFSIRRGEENETFKYYVS